jgi:hypothetical protein
LRTRILRKPSLEFCQRAVEEVIALFPEHALLCAEVYQRAAHMLIEIGSLPLSLSGKTGWRRQKYVYITTTTTTTTTKGVYMCVCLRARVHKVCVKCLTTFEVTHTRVCFNGVGYRLKAE